MQSCNDKNCPIHGSLKIRGAMMEGIVVSNKPKNTVIIERSYLRFIPKYERYERRKTRIAAHKPSCMNINIGDKVMIGECKKISKTKSFVVMKKVGEKD